MCRRAVVAGGGLLGLEAAYALHKLGLARHRARALATACSPPARRARRRSSCCATSRGSGLEIVLEAETQRVEPRTGTSTEVRLADGRRSTADILLVAAGIAPNVELARAGRARGRPRRDRRRPHADERPAHLRGRRRRRVRRQVAGLWPTAVEQAEVAAENAVGGDEAYAGDGPGDDPQGRRHRADLDRPLRAGEPRRGGDRARGRGRAPLPQARDLRTGGSSARSCSATRARRPASSRAVKEGRDVTRWLEELRAGDWSTFVDEPQPAAVA